MRSFVLAALFLCLVAHIEAHSRSAKHSHRHTHNHLKSATKPIKPDTHHPSKPGPGVLAAISKGASLKPQADGKGTPRQDQKPGTSARASSGSTSACTFSTLAALENGKKSCKSIVLNNMVVPAGKTLDLSGLDPKTSITFAGKTTFGYQEWKGPLILIDGQVSVTGAKSHVIDCQGARWWDGKGTNGGKTKPQFCLLHAMSNTVVSNLNVLNTPVQAFAISDSSHLTLENITLNNKDGDAKGGHNTDAFDIGTSNFITITGAKVQNQDDCLAVNSGTDIIFQGASCNNGNGISIGSVGNREINTVERVKVVDCDVVNSLHGARVKTIKGATGKVDSVTFSDVRLSGIRSAGIVVDQSYDNGRTGAEPTSGVPITNLRIIGVTGTVTNTAMPVQIKCGKGACKGWEWDSKITGGTPADKENCMNAPPSAKCS